jgi:hypothetical protein
MAAGRDGPFANSPQGRRFGSPAPWSDQGLGGPLSAARARRQQITDWTLTEER